MSEDKKEMNHSKSDEDKVHDGEMAVGCMITFFFLGLIAIALLYLFASNEADKATSLALAPSLVVPLVFYFIFGGFRTRRRTPE